MTKEQDLLNLVRSNVKLIQIISYESLRIHAMLVKTAEELGKDLFVWNRVEGIKKWNIQKRQFEIQEEDKQMPDTALDFFKENNNLILLLEDFYPDLTEDKPRMIKTFRNIALENTQGKTLVLSQPFLKLPKELEKEVHILELPYPDFSDITVIYNKVCNKYEIAKGDPDPELIEAALGLTIMEAEKAFALA